VLDGDLDAFMAAALSQRVTGEKVAVEDVDCGSSALHCCLPRRRWGAVK
jgi:hypothetical protein